MVGGVGNGSPQESNVGKSTPILSLFGEKRNAAYMTGGSPLPRSIRGRRDLHFRLGKEKEVGP